MDLRVISYPRGEGATSLTSKIDVPSMVPLFPML